MKSFLFALCALCSICIWAQGSWINYSNDHYIHDVAVDGQFAWMGTQGGLVRVAIESGDKQIYQAWNSGLRGQEIQEIEIASDGTKWIGSTTAGLFSFDGNNDWRNYFFINTGDTLRNISDLKLDPSGNPWFLSIQNGSCTGCSKLISFDGQTFTNHQANLQQAITGGVTDFAFIDDTEMWVVLHNELVRYDGQGIIASYSPVDMNFLSTERIRRIAVDGEGKLWLSTRVANSGTIDSRLIRFDGTEWEVISDNIVAYAESIVRDSEGGLWFNWAVTNSGEERRFSAYDGNVLRNWRSEDTGVPYLHTGPLLLEVDAEGRQWYGTFTGVYQPKVYQIDGNMVNAYDTQIDRLGTNYYSRMMADCNGAVWVTGLSAVNRLVDGEWEDFTVEQADALPDLEFFPVLNEATCDTWLFFDKQQPDDVAYGVYDGTNLTTHQLDFDGITHVEMVDANKLYIASIYEAALLENGNLTIFNESNSPIDDLIYDLEVASDETVWISTYWGGLYRKQGNDWTVWDTSNSPLHEYVNKIFLDKNDNLWVSSDEGLAKYTEAGWELFAMPEALGQVLAMAQDTLGNFWLGGGRGIAYWNGFDFKIYNSHNAGLPVDAAWEIWIDDARENIWFLHFAGLSVLSDYKVGNSLSGLAFFDVAQDGLFDGVSDVRLPNERVMLLPDSVTAITNSIGSYSFYPSSGGEYQIDHQLQAPFEAVSASSWDTVLVNESITELNFALWTEDVPEGFTIDLAASPMVCFRETGVWVTVQNQGFLPIDAVVSLTIPEGITEVVPYPDAASLTDDLVVWELEQLPAMQSRTFRLEFNAPGVDALNLTHTFTATMEVGNESQTVSADRLLLCSYDPNDKLVQPVGESIENYSLLADPLQYTIRFQNMGNYFAEDVEIRDVIDASLNLNSLRVLSSSHEVTTTIKSDREVIFRFEDINLPADEDDFLGSQGYVKYQIAPIANLPDPTIVENTAGIYFDLNPAIITNTTENILVETLEVGSEDLMANEPVRLYPNPTRDGFWVDWQNAQDLQSWEVSLFDLSGKLLSRQAFFGWRGQVVLPEEKQGLYLVRIQQGDYSVMKKVVVIR